MEITKHIKNGTMDAVLSGKFTFSDNPAFREILEKIGDPDVRQVVLHMEQVEFVDSAALGMLLLARDEAEKQQKLLIIKGIAGQVKKMFEVAHFHTLFTIQ